jgi:hypothetical protein
VEEFVMLTCYYDLGKCPPTYDIVASLCHFEQVRIDRGEQTGKIIFIAGPNQGFRFDEFWPFTIQERHKMLANVAIPMARMLPKFTVEFQDGPCSAVKGSIGYGQRRYGLNVLVAAMTNGIRPLVSPRSLEDAGILKYSNIVTMTLRECEHWPERNCDLVEWSVAAKELQIMGFEVIIIRDTLHANDIFSYIETCPNASHNIDFRANVYKLAYRNLFVNNGPAWFAMALDAPVIMLKPTIEGLMRTCSKEYFAQCGIPEGEQIPNAPTYQQLVWEDDTTENIVAAFNASR